MEEDSISNPCYRDCLRQTMVSLYSFWIIRSNYCLCHQEAIHTSLFLFSLQGCRNSLSPFLHPHFTQKTLSKISCFTQQDFRKQGCVQLMVKVSGTSLLGREYFFLHNEI